MEHGVLTHPLAPQQEGRPQRLAKKKSSPDVLFRSLQHQELNSHMCDPSVTHPQPGRHRHSRTVGFNLSPHAESLDNGIMDGQAPTQSGEDTEAEGHSASPG